MSKLSTCSSILVIAAIGGLAQSTTVSKEFDVAAIKPNHADDNRFSFRALTGGTLVATGVTLKLLIMEAYQVKAFQVSGGPDWMNTERWDVEAKAVGVPGRIPLSEIGPMLQVLIEDRFQLKIHRETKEMPVYALVVGKNGTKLKPSAGGPGPQISVGRNSLIFKNAKLAPLSTQLSQQLGRIVIDRTDLQGEYDFTLEWMPEPGQGGPAALGLPPEPAPPPDADSGSPSIFTAVQEQLGLRLDSQKGPVEILVIDGVEKPSEN